ncbi:MAG: pyridoxamine 5'-phosphate oxidase family protein [Planctomycetota bacterium]|jgi:uncharacterized pyridoxamine 5'-phosphate oxidase family protein|nr:pyridoxamine 5'-phosphate oxidase family protein [Planctomycetota bacterium]
MKEVLDFLKNNQVFQFATMEGDQPRNRPFGFHMVHNNRIYFITGDHKPVYRQLRANPKFELSVSNEAGEWLRLRGSAVFDPDPKLLEEAFRLMPMLKDIYGDPKGPKPAMFYASQAEATLADMRGKNEIVTL